MAKVFDIHIQTLPAAEQIETFKFMSFGFQASIGVKGFQMLINQWLKCLLTAKGSDPTAMDYGTPFTTLIGSNVSPEDARDVVILSIEQTNSQISAFHKNDTTLTPSERLASAKMVNFTPDRSAPGFNASVELRNQADEILLLNIPTFSVP